MKNYLKTSIIIFLTCYSLTIKADPSLSFTKQFEYSIAQVENCVMNGDGRDTERLGLYTHVAHPACTGFYKSLSFMTSNTRINKCEWLMAPTGLSVSCTEQQFITSKELWNNWFLDNISNLPENIDWEYHPN